ncbi:MAG: polysaccharide biosynthesis/export family protein [Hyphomicrobiaceae bacterium]
MPSENFPDMQAMQVPIATACQAHSATGEPNPRRGMSSRAVASAALLVALGVSIPLPGPPAPLARATNNEIIPAHTAASDYKLVPLDTIRIHVFEWRPAKDEVFTWTAINREYKIGPSGIIALPLVGEIPAAGLTTGELSEAIANRMRSRLNLAILPDATVEIVAYRPVHVTGDVEKAGEVVFTPGMTVLQALSLGGGFRRVSGAGVSRIAREVITTAGDIEVLLHERAMLIARSARLEAELSSANSVATPRDPVGRGLGSDERVLEPYLEQERQAFAGRRTAHQTNKKALAELKHNLEQEVTSLSQQLGMHDKQIKLMESELQGISDLARQRLATQPRLLGLQRNIVQLESERIRIRGALARARQEAKRAGITMLEQENKRTNEIMQELQTTTFKLDVLTQRVGTLQRLLLDSTAGSGAVLAEAGLKPAEVTYTVVRTIGDRPVSIAADENTRLEAGDILKVDRSGGLKAPDKGKAAPAPVAPSTPQLMKRKEQSSDPAQQGLPRRASIEPEDTDVSR